MRMNRRIWMTALVPVAALGMVAGSLSQAKSDAVPGVTSTEIVLGGTHPYSGPASAYGIIGKGIAAYFQYINDQGGVNGRKITYKDLDDGYSPPQALQLTKQLVESDHVFAMFNSLGTPVNTALRPYLNDQKVPQLFVATGATKWGADASKYPWTIGWQPDYQAEAVVFGKDIIKNNPNAKIGVLYQNDDFGTDYIAGLQKGLGAKAGQIIKTASYEVTDPDVRSQIATLKGSGADTILIAATPKFATQALAAIGGLSWKVTTYLTDVSSQQTVMHAATAAGGAAATNGVISAGYTLDPTNTSQANLPGMKLYREIAAKYAPSSDASNASLLYGMGVAYTMVDILKAAGKDITREKVMAAAEHISEKNPFLYSGVDVTTSPSDRFPIREEYLMKYDNGLWNPAGTVIDARR